MNNLYIMIGLPGSGKSTIAKNISVKENAIIVSTDELRGKMLDDVNNQEKNSYIFLEAEKIMKENLKTNNVIFDATNIDYKRRRNLINKFSKYTNQIILCFVWASYYECLARNEMRERKVPEEVIKRMYMNIDTPQLFEERYIENKVQIEIYYNSQIDFTKINIKEIEDKINISHDNPHHKLNVLEHSLKASDMFEESSLKLAAYLHDIGKPFCKTFINTKGEKTDIAHYYNHEKVGAYDSIPYILNHTFNNLEKYKYPYWYTLYISNLIRWHMLLYSNLSNEKIKKYIDLFGETFWIDLKLLHEADKNAD